MARSCWAVSAPRCEVIGRSAVLVLVLVALPAAAQEEAGAGRFRVADSPVIFTRIGLTFGLMLQI